LVSWRAFALFALPVAGCGSRTGLDFRVLVETESGGATTAGGSSSRGGMPAAGGRATGGAGARPMVGGAAGKVSMGGALGGEPSMGGATLIVGGEGGAPNGGVGGADGGSGGEPSTPLATELATGAFTSCAGFDDGSLRCWGTGGYIGSGNNTTIGDDETPDTLGPVVLGGPVKQLTSSWYHSCALLRSGKLRCFGNGGAGALGYGNTAHVGDDETPASAGDVNVGGKVLQVSAGPYHTCAVLSGGHVRCWGKNDHHQLGYANGASIGDDESPASAPFVDVGGLVQQVAAGFAHTCALLDTGKVRCWGDSIGGSLGYGNANTIGDDETPASAGDVDVGGTVVQIVTGLLHTCVLLDNGKVRCWGGGDDGRLGYGNVENIGDNETPASAGDVDVGGSVKQLASGEYATCALLTTGKVRCWGSPTSGVLGYGNAETIGDDETPASAGDVNVGATVTRISVGFLHVCAILETGSVRCWGRGSTGALGYGNKNDIGDNETPASAGDLKLL
jgi:alpha-tubulin suppressor-like RCC1 family protein